MNKKIYKYILIIFCIVLLLLTINKLNICDDHMFLHSDIECIQCLLINSIEETIKNIYLITTIIILLNYFIILSNNIDNFKFNKYINLVSMKVRLNE